LVADWTIEKLYSKHPSLTTYYVIPVNLHVVISVSSWLLMPESESVHYLMQYCSYLSITPFSDWHLTKSGSKHVTTTHFQPSRPFCSSSMQEHLIRNVLTKRS